jgi:hypothetical protein
MQEKVQGLYSYNDKLTTKEAENILNNQQIGSYLIRKSPLNQKKPDNDKGYYFAISFVDENKEVNHRHIYVPHDEQAAQVPNYSIKIQDEFIAYVVTNINEYLKQNSNQFGMPLATDPLKIKMLKDEQKSMKYLFVLPTGEEKEISDLYIHNNCNQPTRLIAILQNRFAIVGENDRITLETIHKMVSTMQKYIFEKTYYKYPDERDNCQVRDRKDLLAYSWQDIDLLYKLLLNLFPNYFICNLPDHRTLSDYLGIQVRYEESYKRGKDVSIYTSPERIRSLKSRLDELNIYYWENNSILNRNSTIFDLRWFFIEELIKKIAFWSFHPELNKGAMKNRVGNSKCGYIRHSVISDGECGYTAFGITRQQALELLTNNLNKIRTILQPAIHELLLTEEFYKYLVNNNCISPAISHERITQDLTGYGDNLNVLQCFLYYDVRDKRRDAGWSHPSTLQALAHIRHLGLRIWRLGEQEQLVPHRGPLYDYAKYAEGTVDQWIDLLFTDGNHFDRLEIVSETGELEDRIYPANSSQSLTNKRYQSKYQLIIDGLTRYLELEPAISQNISIIESAEKTTILFPGMEEEARIWMLNKFRRLLEGTYYFRPLICTEIEPNVIVEITSTVPEMERWFFKEGYNLDLLCAYWEKKNTNFFTPGNKITSENNGSNKSSKNQVTEFKSTNNELKETSLPKLSFLKEAKNNTFKNQTHNTRLEMIKSQLACDNIYVGTALLTDKTKITFPRDVSLENIQLAILFLTNEGISCELGKGAYDYLIKVNNLSANQLNEWLKQAPAPQQASLSSEAEKHRIK